MAQAQEVNVRLRVICYDPPLAQIDGRPTQFGLQDKSGALRVGVLQGNGARVFECEVRAKPTEDGGVNFLGDYTHGTPSDRFLYLSYGYVDNPGDGWIKRIKVPLSDIQWAQVERTINEGQVLEASVDGQRAAKVETLGSGSGWSVTQP
jgi:hypothetical protein